MYLPFCPTSQLLTPGKQLDLHKRQMDMHQT